MNQKPEYIEGINGSITIAISRHSDEISLVFGGVEARLSIEDAFRLAYLLQSNAAPIPVPSDDKPQPVRPSVKRKRFSRHRETISDLIEENLIEVGALLTIKHKYTEHSGKVTADGMIEVDEYIERTPSAAGSRVVGRTCNGWQEWSVYGGPQLADLRWMLRAKRFPGENHGYTVSTLREKKRIATGWVDYALARELDPSKKDIERIEDYLDERQLESDKYYSESTMTMYRRHLHQWFEWCKANNW